MYVDFRRFGICWHRKVIGINNTTHTKNVCKMEREYKNSASSTLFVCVIKKVKGATDVTSQLSGLCVENASCVRSVTGKKVFGGFT